MEILDGFNITTKRLSIIYPDYEDKNIIFLETAGFEIPLCETDEIFKIRREEKKGSIKDYLREDDYIEQIKQFNGNNQITDYFF